MTAFENLDTAELGAQAQESGAGLVQRIKDQAMQEFGQENVLPDDTARDLMIGVGAQFYKINLEFNNRM